MFKGLNAICKTFVLHTPAWGFQSTSTACCVVGSFHPFPVPQSRDHHWFLVLHTHLPFPVIIKCYMHFNLPINFQVANFGPRALCLVCS